MIEVSQLGRLSVCALVLAVSALAQCPPSGGYAPPPPSAPPPPPPPPPVTRWVPGNPDAPASPGPATPSTPSAPGAPKPTGPVAGPTTPAGGPSAARPSAGRTGPRGVPMTFTRGATSKDRLFVDWFHPVPPKRDGNTTSAAGPLPMKDALELMWADGDHRPLLVLRECSKCKDSDEAVLHRALDNERTMLLMSWFRTVRLPAHVAERGHSFFNVFEGHGFEGGWPHFFLLAHPGAAPVKFEATATPPQLWKGMTDVLELRYAKSPQKALKAWLSQLDTFDRLDSRKRELEDQLADARIEQGPDSARAKKLAAELAENASERVEALAKEREIKDLGLLPMPRTVASAGR